MDDKPNIYLKIIIDLTSNRLSGIFKIPLIILVLVINGYAAYSQCVPQSVPYPQLGGMPGDIAWVNLWYSVDSEMQRPTDQDPNAVIIGNDGWPIAGRVHSFGIDVKNYFEDSQWGVQYGSAANAAINGGIYKIYYKGTVSQFGPGTPGNWSTTWNRTVVSAVDNYQGKSGYAYIEVRLFSADGKLDNLAFTINGHIEEIQIVRPGYELFDTRLVTE